VLERDIEGAAQDIREKVLLGRNRAVCARDSHPVHHQADKQPIDPTLLASGRFPRGSLRKLRTSRCGGRFQTVDWSRKRSVDLDGGQGPDSVLLDAQKVRRTIHVIDVRDCFGRVKY